MALTTYKNEEILWQKGIYALVAVDDPRPFREGKKMLVTVAGGHTDYPHVQPDGWVTYDNPEYLPQYAREAIRRTIAKRISSGIDDRIEKLL
jgi:hypothetical protein